MNFPSSRGLFRWIIRYFLRTPCVVIPFICFLSGCAHHPDEPPFPSQTPPPLANTASPASPVEQQLLATVKNAEQLGPGNPLLLSSLYSLATYYEDRQAYDKAANLYQRALQVKEEANGPNHSDVAVILQRYARLLQKANRHAEAENLLLRADAILANSSASPPSSIKPE